MRPSRVLLMACLIAPALPAQGESGRRQAVAALAGSRPDDAAVAANLPQIVDLLVDADRNVRHRALAAVLLYPARFASQRARLTALLADAPDDTVLRAAQAISPFRSRPVEAAIELLDTNAPDRIERGVNALRQAGADVLPHLDAIVARALRERRLQELLVDLAAAGHRAEVAAAVHTWLATAEHWRAGELVRLLRRIGADGVAIERTTLAMFATGRHDVMLMRKLAAESATFRASLVDLLLRAEPRSVQPLWAALADSRALLFDQWSKLATLLTSALHVHDATAVAIVLAGEHPTVVSDLVDALVVGHDDVAGTIAGGLARLPPGRRTVGVLASRLATAERSRLALLDALLALGADDVLREALPATFDVAEPLARVRACQLSVVLGERGDQVVRRLTQLLAQEPDDVRGEAELALRYLQSHVTRSELADHVRDRDPYRVLAAHCHLRRSHSEFSPGEEVAFHALSRHAGFGERVRRMLDEDIAAGRITSASAEQLRGPPRMTPRLTTLLLASQNDRLREALVQSGALREQDLPEPGEPVERLFERLVDRLGDPDVRVRDIAFEMLCGGGPIRSWRTHAATARRSGSADQRRLLALALGPMDIRTAVRALAMPEPSVVERALEVLLERRERVSRAIVREVLQQLVDRPELCRRVLLRPGAQRLVSLVAAGEEAAMPLVRLAMADARLRPQAIAALRHVGESAREFVPELIRALRTDDAANAGAVLLAIGIDRAGEHGVVLRRELAHEWGRRERRVLLLPALMALGAEHGSFATADLDDVFGGMLGAIGVAEERRRRIELAVADAGGAHVAQLFRIAVALDVAYAAPGVRREGAFAGAGLRRQVLGLYEAAQAGERDELLRHLFDALAESQPLPATAAVLREHADQALRVLERDRKPLWQSPAVAGAIAAELPMAFLATVPNRDLAREPLLAGLQALPHDRQVARALATLVVSEDLDASLRDEVLRVLLGQGELAVPAELLAAGGERQLSTLRAIAATGPAAKSLLPAVLEHFDGAPEASREALVHLGSRGLMALLHRVPESEHVRWLERAATVADVESAGAALRLLQGHSPSDALRVARAVAHRPGTGRWAGFVQLSADGPIDPDVVVALGRDDEHIVRLRAAQALAGIATWSPEVGLLATDLLADEQAAVRLAAARAFGARDAEIAASETAIREALAAERDEAVEQQLRRLLEHR